MTAPHPDQRWGNISFAQHGDDFMILNLFELLGVPDNEGPSWLDLGAHHPESISNTKLLSDKGRWGVNVEANPNLMALLQAQRPHDVNLNIGIGLSHGVNVFHMYSPTSGRNTFSDLEVEAMARLMTVREEITLPITTLNQLVYDELGGVFPPLLSCDIEGLDLEVMRQTNFSYHPPKIICVETRRQQSWEMIAALKGKGFSPYCRMGENLFFVLEELTRKCF